MPKLDFLPRRLRHHHHSSLPSFPPSPPWAAQIGQMNGRGCSRARSLSLSRSITLLIFAGSPTLRHSEPSLALSLSAGATPCHAACRLLSLMKLFFNSLLPPPLSLCPSVPPSLPPSLSIDGRSVVRPLEQGGKRVQIGIVWVDAMRCRDSIRAEESVQAQAARRAAPA